MGASKRYCEMPRTQQKQKHNYPQPQRRATCTAEHIGLRQPRKSLQTAPLSTKSACSPNNIGASSYEFNSELTVIPTIGEPGFTNPSAVEPKPDKVLPKQSELGTQASLPGLKPTLLGCSRKPKPASAWAVSTAVWCRR